MVRETMQEAMRRRGREAAAAAIARADQSAKSSEDVLSSSSSGTIEMAASMRAGGGCTDLPNQPQRASTFTHFPSVSRSAVQEQTSRGISSARGPDRVAPTISRQNIPPSASSTDSRRVEELFDRLGFDDEEPRRSGTTSNVVQMRDGEERWREDDEDDEVLSPRSSSTRAFLKEMSRRFAAGSVQERSDQSMRRELEGKEAVLTFEMIVENPLNENDPALDKMLPKGSKASQQNFNKLNPATAGKANSKTPGSTSQRVGPLLGRTFSQHPTAPGMQNRPPINRSRVA